MLHPFVYLSSSNASLFLSLSLSLSLPHSPLLSLSLSLSLFFLFTLHARRCTLFGRKDCARCRCTRRSLPLCFEPRRCPLHRCQRTSRSALEVRKVQLRRGQSSSSRHGRWQFACTPMLFDSSTSRGGGGGREQWRPRRVRRWLRRKRKRRGRGEKRRVGEHLPFAAACCTRAARCTGSCTQLVWAATCSLRRPLCSKRSRGTASSPSPAPCYSSSLTLTG